MRKIVLAGGSGFLGRTLARWFPGAIVLSRREGGVAWDGRTLGSWTQELEGADAVVNLAGRSVNCRYTRRNRRQILESRIESTRILGEAIRNCATPPRVWLNSSTATIYKHTFGEPHGEDGLVQATPEAKDAFSIEVARAWEDEFFRADTPSTRKVALRTAMVFGSEPGGVFHALRGLTRWWLGGKMAHGRQFVSWIHADDFCRSIETLIENPRAEGVYNLAAPNPVTHREMMACFRRVYGKRIGLPAARWMLEIGAFFLRTETELLIKSRRVIPSRLLAEGFVFRYPRLEEALAVLA